MTEILRRSLEQAPSPDGKRRSRWAIVRQTYPELKTTTIKTWHGLVPQHVGRWVDQGPPTHHLTSDDLDIEVIFLALDSPEDVKKLLSVDLTGAFVNEAREVPKAVIDGLTGRVGRYPGKAQGGPTWFGVLLDTNPPDTDHWWYMLSERDASTSTARQLLESTIKAEESLIEAGLLRPGQKLFEFFAQPSGLSDEAENKSNLPPGYYERMIAGKSEDWIRVYVHGEYGFIKDGRPVYPEYQDSVHCREFELNPALPLYVGIDFGLTPAAIIGQRTMTGGWRWRYEICAEYMGAKQFAELALKPKMAELEAKGFKFERLTGDPAGDQSAQTDEETPFRILRSCGIPAQPAPTNDFGLRREAVTNALSRLIDGEPGLIIHPDCAMTRKGMAGRYAWKRIRVAGDERYQDKPDKNQYSHPCEAGQYMLLGGGEVSVMLGTRSRSRPRYAMT